METPRHHMGAGGDCVCPRCGQTVPHKRGEPCQQTRCPWCGAKMLREGSHHYRLFERKRALATRCRIAATDSQAWRSLRQARFLQAVQQAFQGPLILEGKCKFHSFEGEVRTRHQQFGRLPLGFVRQSGAH